METVNAMETTSAVQKRSGILYPVMLIAALVAGCTTAPEPAPEASQVNLGGFSPAFKQGYADGCESAGARSQRRNEGRYKTESDYMRGWNDGFSICAKRK
jgi:hypothetical protein